MARGTRPSACSQRFTATNAYVRCKSHSWNFVHVLMPTTLARLFGAPLYSAFLGDRHELIYPRTDLSPNGPKWEDGGRVQVTATIRGSSHGRLRRLLRVVASARCGSP